MNLQETVKNQLRFWHGMVDSMVAQCPPELLHAHPEGSAANPIAAVYAHIVFAEDVLVQGHVKGVQPLFASDWKDRLGVGSVGTPPTMDRDWALSLKLDLPAFQQYAQAVYMATDAFLSGVSDEEVARSLPSSDGGDPFPVSRLIGNVVATHLPFHTGEISAMLGAAGRKGLPF